MKIDFAFITAQARWKLTKGIYFPSNFTNFKKEVLAPALKKAEKEAKVSAKPVSPSWYEQLKKAESKLPKSERSKPIAEREKEFKAWQQNKGRTKLDLSEESKELLQKLVAKQAENKI